MSEEQKYEARSVLVVVAHPDDDIIFMNPDLETFNRSGSPSCTVYVTSGDLDTASSVFANDCENAIPYGAA